MSIVRRIRGPVLVTLLAAVVIGSSAGAMATSAGFVGPDYPANEPACRPFNNATPPVQQSKGLTPRQWQSVVGLPTPVTGTPLPQRIVVLERNQNADLAGVASLLSLCGLPAVAVTEVGDVGAPNAGEATLDAAIIAAGLPPNTSMVMANSNAGNWGDVLQVSAEACGIDTSATPPVKRTVAISAAQAAWPAGGCIISASYSDNESQYFPNPSSGTQRAIALLDSLEALGVIVVFSAGDESSGGCSTNAATTPASVGLQTRFPTSHPAVLGVGGTQWDDQVTSMSGTGRSATYVPGATYENWVWKDTAASPKCANAPTGGTSGGGGRSTVFAQPEYQRSASRQNYPGNPGSRLVPDVTALAMWPTYALRRLGSWELNGGTSAAAPSVAVGLANVNASLSARGLPVIDNGGGAMDIHRIVYDPAMSGAIADVTLGDNDLFGFSGAAVMPGYDPSLPAWKAQPGYDMASGVGVINFTALLNALIARAAPASTGLSPWLQAVGRPTSTTACQEGWHPSWAEWPNGGSGGWTCVRTLRWVPWASTWQPEG